MSNKSGLISIGGLVGRIDLFLLALICLLVVINIPYWDSQFMVGSDTKNTYLAFHYFYNHLVWYSELPQWLPYGEYGYSSLFYQICDFSPSSYLTGLIGWALRVRNTLILFKLAAFGDQLLFLLGLHLLSRYIYRHRITCFIICLLGIGSVVWTWQIYWCLRFFYLVPLALYFYYRFFVERLSWAFWATLLTLLFVLVGGLPYWVPIYFYLFLVMTLIMLPEYWRSFGSLFRPGWRDGLLAAVVVSSVIALGYVLLTCLEGLHNYSPGRATEGMYTDLKTFLTFNSPFWRYVHSFIDGTVPYGEEPTGFLTDLNLYVGLLPLGTLLFALLHVRNRIFFSLVGGLAAILLLAANGMSSVVLYWLMPGMKAFRHLGLLLEFAKVLLLLSAGFGLDLLITRLKVRGWLKKHFSTFVYVSLMVGLCVSLDMVVSQMAYNPKCWTSPMQFAAMLPKGGELISIRLAVWGIILTVIFVGGRAPSLGRFLTVRMVTVLLVVACLVDMGTFQCFQWQYSSHSKNAGRLELRPLSYNNRRDKEYTAEAKRDDKIIRYSEDAVYLGYYANIIQYDPCIPARLIQLFPRGVHELVTARGANPVQQKMWGTFLPFSDHPLLDVLGCDANKIRFVTQAVHGKTDREVTSLLSFRKDLDATVILKGGAGQQSGRSLPGLEAMIYRPTFFNANRLDLDVSVQPGFAGWLTYADAFDRHWKAYVNGKERPVLEAYGAFKAIALEGGTAKVSFRYENRWQQYAMGLLMFGGILSAFGCLAALGWQLFGGRKS